MVEQQAQPATGEDAEGRRSTAYEPDPRRWRILAVSLVVGFMSLLDVTIVNVAIPSMQSGLDTSAAAVQWVVSGYALSFGLVLVIGGRLGDAFGRRRLMLVGLTGFVVSSALVGIAPGIELVVAARLLQGISAGLLTPQNSGLIQTLFRGAERGRAFGLFGFVVSISSALGPVLGGLIITLAGSEDGWRWIFWVNVPVGLVALVLVARIVPSEVSSEGDDPRLDLVGALLLGLAVLCVIYPLVSLEGGGYRWLVLLAAVPALGWAFVRWERRVVARGGAPLLFVAGLGGGAVISPNITLTLDEVPPRMGGAAGGALQTGQRIGSALGTAAGVTAYTVVATSYGAAAGLRAALVVAALMVAASLAVAVRSLRS
ncbi:MFS transporter [Nocardioides sp. REDSEA-S30_B4]|uniref:MFS transporter n=1 Tax=Nocardioides sp. REDSEA-S30_B4 TaxID=1811552 RepID=UPI0025EBFBCE|nr:MFS transporter [Nocardioides sp. REDSEA-S30_B4]